MTDLVTTRWRVVLDSQGEPTPGGQQALATLCELYWYPLGLHKLPVGRVSRSLGRNRRTRSRTGLDGTVVAFPMLVRGMSPIPPVNGSESKILGAESIQ